ncbi:MAG: signal peptide peptidase SppA [Devosia sp.]
MTSPSDSDGTPPPQSNTWERASSGPGEAPKAAATDTAHAPEPRHQTAHLLVALDRLRRSRRLWRVLFVVALLVAALAATARFAGAGRETGDQIARIGIDGTILTDRTRLRAIERIAEDERVKAVIIDINSPGGTTAGGEELYEALSRLRTEKPVVAVIRELGASAAYMTAIAADHIVSRRLSIVGSIGVLYQHVDAGKLFDTIGIDLDKVATGPLKAEPSFDEPISPAARQSLQALVDDSFAWFVDIVAERRGLERPVVLGLADGRIMTGRVGVETGLIDANGGEAEAIAWLEAERDIAEDLPIITWYPVPSSPLGDLGQWLGSQMRATIGLPASGPIALDGLVSLWQVGPA